MDITVKICGSAGDGVQSVGDLLTNSIAFSGIHVLNFRSYGAEIRASGNSDAIVRMADYPISSFKKDIDILLCIHNTIDQEEVINVATGGILLFDNTPKTVTDTEENIIGKIPPEVEIFGVPITQIAQQYTGGSKGKNIALFGALLHLLTIPQENGRKAIASFWKNKGDDFVTKNILSFDHGYEFAQQNMHSSWPKSFQSMGNEALQVLSGNQAMAKGAINAGCKVYAGYPITPATTILEILARELPKKKGKVIQTEDEIAAIGVVLGASFTGVRAMTATSGPGLSLMIEQLGLSYMAEVPCVVVCVQRGGPSTGLPTKTEQSDLNIAIYGAHGDASRIVLAPTNVYECYTCIIKAFDYAQRYQMPVIILSDFFLANRRESVNIQFQPPESTDTRVKPSTDDAKNQNYDRFKITENGISPMAVPGEEGTFFTATGLEHNEHGKPVYTGENHTVFTNKRFRKLETVREEITTVDIIGNSESDVGILSWGSTMGAVIEAISIAQKEGIAIKALKTDMLWPLPEKEISAFVDSVKKVIIPELNYQGQFANLLNFIDREKIIKVNIIMGAPLSSYDILEHIKKVCLP